MSFPAPIAHAPPWWRAAYPVLLALSLLLWLLPLAGVALTSIRPLEDIQRGEFWTWPTRIGLENYGAVLWDSVMARFILNSFLITLPSVAGAVALSCMAGFALAQYRFRGNAALLAVFVAGNLVPFQVLMIPVRELMVDRLGLYDTRWALIVFHVSFQTGFCTLFMRNFFRQLPAAIFDTARVDGWSEARIFLQLALPLVRPAIAAMAALIFTFVWNDYFWSLILVHSDEVRPVTAGLQSLRGMWLAAWHLICAGSIIAALPPVAVFFLMQQHFVAALTLGSGDE